MGNLLLRASLLLIRSDGSDALTTAYDKFKSIVGTILPIVIAVVLLLGMFYGISLGIKFAKAEDTDARDKAKGQLINLAIGIGVAAVILIVAYELVHLDAFKGLFPALRSSFKVLVR